MWALTGCRKGAVPAALVTDGPAAARRELQRLIEAFGRDRVLVELWDHGDPLDSARNDALAELAARHDVGCVATTNAHYATPAQRRLATALAAVRARSSLAELDPWLPAAAGAHLRSGAEQRRRFARYPGVVELAAEIGRAAAFDLSLVAPSLPPFPCPDGWSRDGVPPPARRGGRPPSLRRAPATRTSRCGRAWRRSTTSWRSSSSSASPATSSSCGTSCASARRSTSSARGGGARPTRRSATPSASPTPTPCRSACCSSASCRPSATARRTSTSTSRATGARRSSSTSTRKHGRHHTAQVANVITYRAKSAIRDMAKALGARAGPAGRVVEAGRRVGHGAHDAASNSTTARRPATSRQPVLELAMQVEDAPRHLGIHSGGMVICDRPVIEVCPVEWGRMEDRSVLQWDKDDCAAAGLVKFDLLGLGMLSALHYAVDLIREHRGYEIDLATIPQEDEVYAMLCRADTVGVFQIESRAQMATLPRLEPRRFYDLVVEVALIRPGPIQGGSVHPYIRRRNGQEPITYLHPLLENSLGKTLGVPLFQEQLMQMAIDVAGFTPAESDELRQAMGSKRSAARMERLKSGCTPGWPSGGSPATSPTSCT